MPLLLPPSWGQAAGFVAIGYGVRNAGMCKDQEIQAASRFGSTVLAPAVILQSLLRLPSLHSAWALVMGATAIAILLSLVVMWVTTPKRHPAQRALLLGCSVGGLVSTTALPLLFLLFGSVAVQIAAVAGMITATSVLAGSYLLCSTSQSAYPKNYRHEDGGVYNGQWQGKNKQGLGSYQYPGGAKYEGEWRNNCKEGRGVYTFPKGGSYEGEWHGGEREGVGIRTMRSGKVLAGRWEQGQLAVPMEEWQCALAAETAHHAARAAKRVPVGQGELGVALQQVLISPVLLATLAGMLLSVLRLSPPPTVVTLSGILAVPFAPLMLIVHGASLRTKGIPASQWQDVCQVTAARYVPPLMLLAGALSCVALPGAALPLVSPSTAAVAMVTSVALISPAPLEVSQYAQRFNLSASLASSITRLSSWVSSALLLALLSVTGTHMHRLAAAQEAVSVTDLVAAVRGPLLTLAATAAAVLMIGVPVSASLAKKSRSQGPKRSQAAAAGNTSPSAAENKGSSAGNAESLAAMYESEVSGRGKAGPRGSLAVADTDTDEVVEDAAVEGPEQEPSEATISDAATLPDDSQAFDTGSSSNVGTAGLGLDSNVHKGPNSQGSRQADGDSVSGTADGPVEGPVEEPSEDMISDPATLPDDNQASGNGGDVNVGTPGFGDSNVGNNNVRKGPDQHGGSHDDRYSSAKSSEENQVARSDAQPPSEGSGRGSRGGFFRDIETNCMPVRRQRHAPLRPRAFHGRHVRHVSHSIRLLRQTQVDPAATTCNNFGHSRWLRVI
ncbi:TPA: hypothetical protein ACH3X1_002264 [Trebouxia sp. C0004]